MSLTVYTEKLNPKKYDKDLLLTMYKDMLVCRTFDESIQRMVASGEVKGFYHAGSGEEAIGVGSCVQLNQDDYIFYMHRGCNEMLAKGISPDRLYADFFGNVHGTNKGLGAGIIHSADPDLGVLGQPGTIGSNASLAVGVGIAINHKQSQQVCVAYFGDGTFARETMHGALNYMGVYNLPVILCCENNEYGLGDYFKKSFAIEDYLAEIPAGYKGVDSVVVDGNDVLAVYEVFKKAIDKARSGNGGTFIECKTYRYRGHFEGDPCAYMDAERTAWFKANDDPIVTLRERMLTAGVATQAEFDAIDAEVKAADKAAIEEAKKYPMPPFERLFDGLFS